MAARDPKAKTVGRPRKYGSELALRRAVNGYFASISIQRPVTIDEETIRDEAGKPILQTLWLRPPTVAGLCRWLGIDRSTWANYCNKDLHPEFQAVTKGAQAILEEYLEEELLSRDKPNGVIFNLRANYGWNDKAGETEKPAVRVVLEKAEGWEE